MKSIYKVIFISLILIVPLIAGCGSGGGGGGPQILFSENFDSYAVDAAFDGSQWRYFDGSTLATYYIRESTKALNITDSMSIIYNGAGSSGWTNYSMTFRFKVTTYAVDFASASFRFSNPGSNYSTYFINITNGKISLGKTIATGSSYALGTDADVTYTTTGYSTVRIDVNGNNIKVYFEGVEKINFTDDGVTYGAVLTTGTIGVGTPSGNVYFDDIVVTAL